MISGVIDVSATRTIAAPPDALWPLLDDPQRMGEWFAFAERFEVLGGEGVGRRQRMHGRWGRKRSEIDQVIVAHDPPRRLAWRHEAERLDGRPAPRFAATTTFSATLEPDGAGTRVTLHNTLEGHGFGKLIAPMALRQARKGADEFGAAIKAAVEAS